MPVGIGMAVPPVPIVLLLPRFCFCKSVIFLVVFLEVLAVGSILSLIPFVRVVVGSVLVAVLLCLMVFTILSDTETDV